MKRCLKGLIKYFIYSSKIALLKSSRYIELLILEKLKRTLCHFIVYKITGSYLLYYPKLLSIAVHFFLIAGVFLFSKSSCFITTNDSN